jgi:PAS domain S-box-containing protein
MELNAGLYRSIVEQVPEAIIYADRAGIIRLWNPGAECIFGHSAAEAVGQSLDLIIPQRLRAAHWAGYEKAFETGRMKYVRQVLTTRSIHKNGSTLYVDLSFALVRDAGGVPSGALAVARDVTARYAAEKALKARAQQMEEELRDLKAGGSR